MCMVENVVAPTVFAVALTFGSSKPSNIKFRKETTEELQLLNLDGITSSNGKKVSVKLSQVICDAAAKAIVKL